MKFLVFIFILFFTFPLIAKEKQDLFLLSLEELLQIEVTGSTLTEQNIKTVPSAVTVFTHEHIKRMGLDSLDELMNMVPGFQSYRSSPSSLNYPFSSRGRRISPTSSEILVLVDGQRLADPALGGAATTLPKYPLINIKRVEFIRGPGAAVYGSNAMMGVINIITRSDINEATISAGTNNRRKLSLLTSHIAGDVKIEFFGHIDDDDGENYQVQDTFNPVIPSRINTNDPRQSADFNLKFKWQHTQINLQHNQIKAENFYELDKISNGVNARDAQMSSISLKHDFNWQSISSWLWLGYSSSDLSTAAQLTAPGALTAISNPSSNDVLFFIADFKNVTETRLQWHNDWNINTASSLQFGFEQRYIKNPAGIAYNNFDVGDLANGNFPIRYYGTLLPTTTIRLESSRNITGLYAQYQLRLFEFTEITLGLRYDDFSDIDSQLSPRVTVVQTLNNHHSLKILYGEAFRAPSELELNTTNNPVIQGNPDLKPETVQSWDLIWVGQWSNTGFSLGYFENHFKDSIIEIATSNVSRKFENAKQDPIAGIEFELSYELNVHWLLRTSYTRFTKKPDFSFREAKQLASVMVNYQYSKWNANLITTWHDNREMSTGGNINNRITLDAYWQVFGKLSYNFNQKWQSFLQVKNLLDRDYLTPTTSSDLTEGVPNRGQEIQIGVTWQF